jgi:nucleoside-diphosphate-sugar epimerase
MKVLIIGGTGLIGTYLVSRCVLDGHDVSVISRSGEQLHESIDFIKCDISEPGYSKIINKNFDIVVHLAYATSEDAAYNRAVTVNSVVEVLEYFENTNLKAFIYCGSMSVFGIDLSASLISENTVRVPDCDYAANKIDVCEFLMRAKVSFQVSILHPTGVYDAYSKRIKTYRDMLRSGYICLDAGGGGINNIIHADDVARAVIACFSRVFGNRAEEYIINGELITYREWFSILERSLGNAQMPRIPLQLLKLCRWRMRSLLRMVGLRLPILLPAYKRAMFERKSIFSSDKAFLHLDWTPKRHFIDVITESKSSL